MGRRDTPRPAQRHPTLILVCPAEAASLGEAVRVEAVGGCSRGFGDPGDRFVAGEFLLDTDGSVLGYDAPAVFRPSNTTWYFKRTNSQGVADLSLVYGESPWLPVGGFWAWPEINPGDSKNCTDFVTQPEAQAWHDFFFPFFGDVAKLDTDGDRIACEGLPATTS